MECGNRRVIGQCAWALVVIVALVLNCSPLPLPAAFAADGVLSSAQTADNAEELAKGSFTTNPLAPLSLQTQAADEATASGVAAQASSTLRFDGDIYYVVARRGCSMLLPEADENALERFLR